MASQTRSVCNTVSSQWANPDNAFSENDLCTSTSGDGNQNVYNFVGNLFSIPVDNYIWGIEVKTVRGGDPDDYYQIELQDEVPAWKLKDGTAYQASCAGAAAETLGGEEDRWGGTFSRAHVNSADFQVRLTFQKSAKANTMNVDHIEVIVYYSTEAPPPPPPLVSTSEDETATSEISERKLVKTSDGTLYAVYQRLLAGQYQIYIKKSVDNGETWTDETRISTYAGMENYLNSNPSIAVDSNDYLHVTWHGMATGYTTHRQIWYSKYITSWSTPVRISTYAGMNLQDQRFGSLAIDSSDYLHVVWGGIAEGYAVVQIWYVKYITSWSTPVRLSTYAGMDTNAQFYATITVDSQNYLHVVWYGCATGYVYPSPQIWHAKYTTSWSAPIRISTYAGMDALAQNHPSIAVDSNDYLHVAWFGDATGYPNFQIWYVKYTTSWSAPVRLSTYAGMENYEQFRAHIAVDIRDYIHVLWHGKATGYTDYNKIWYARYETSWSSPVCLQAIGQNTRSNVRWSRYPSSNQVTSRLEYVFTEGTESPYNIRFDYVTLVEVYEASARLIGTVIPIYIAQVRIIGLVYRSFSARARLIGTVVQPFSAQVRNIGNVVFTYSSRARLIGTVLLPFTARVRNIGNIIIPYSARVRLVGAVISPYSALVRLIGTVIAPYSVQVRNIGTISPRVVVAKCHSELKARIRRIF